MSKTLKKILIITGVRIGDQLMATPFFRALRKNFTRAKITLAAGFPALGALRNNPNIDQMITIDKDIVRKIVRRGKFDLAIDLCGASETAYLTVISGAETRIGNRYVGLPDTRPELYTKAVARSRRELSFLDRYLFLAKQMGIKSRGRDTEIFLTKAELKKAEKVLKSKGLTKKDFIIGVFPSGSRKNILWSPERFGRLADRIADESGAKILFFSDKNEEQDIRQAASVMKKKPCLAGTHDIRIISGLISLSACIITSNRGPMHIAAALKVPTIAIFGPYSEKEFFPYPAKDNLTVAKELTCRPCGMGYKRCLYNISCLKSLSVDEVLKKAGPFLRKLQTKRK